MKDTHFLYSMTTLALGSIVAIFVSYATDTLPMPSPRKPIARVAAVSLKKNCGCCDQVTLEESLMLRQRHAKLRKQQQAYRKASQLLREHGLEEGMRRIKQSHPEIAAQLEYFITETN